MSGNGDSSAAVEAGLDAAVVDRAVDLTDVAADALDDALVILHAELIGRHSNLEADTDHVTVDGRRAYRVHESVWDDFLEEFDFDDATEVAVRYAHTEQAKLLFATSVGGTDNFAPEEEGVVIGIDTAEQF
ncbi:MAG: hypothetical protein ABEH47_04335 [Haloferacaceae archaeon]